MSEHEGQWWCQQCDVWVPPVGVTYNETHVVCGVGVLPSDKGNELAQLRDRLSEAEAKVREFGAMMDATRTIQLRKKGGSIIQFRAGDGWVWVHTNDSETEFPSALAAYAALTQPKAVTEVIDADK